MRRPWLIIGIWRNIFSLAARRGSRIATERWIPGEIFGNNQSSSFWQINWDWTVSFVKSCNIHKLWNSPLNSLLKFVKETCALSWSKPGLWCRDPEWRGPKPVGFKRSLSAETTSLCKQELCSKGPASGRCQGSLNRPYPVYPGFIQGFIQKSWLWGKLPTSKSKQASCPNERRAKNYFSSPGKPLQHHKTFSSVQYLFEALVECHKWALRVLRISIVTEITFWTWIIKKCSLNWF